MLSANTEKIADTIDENDIFLTLSREWKEVEQLVMDYKKQFDDDVDAATKERSKLAAEKLLKKFTPLFKKYINLIHTGLINFDDAEMRKFVFLFIGDEKLKRSMRKYFKSPDFQHEVTYRFNFIKETYGTLLEEDIMQDLQLLFLSMAKRYKQMGRNFCAYVYNSFSYEVNRHICKFTKNPANIPYKSYEYIDYIRGEDAITEDYFEDCFEDKIYEKNSGIPDLTWINGTSCSEIFSHLEPLERKLIIKYYMEDFNDRQIAENYNMYISSINHKRRHAVMKLAKRIGLNPSDIKRNRKSGKHTLIKH